MTACAIDRALVGGEGAAAGSRSRPYQTLKQSTDPLIPLVQAHTNPELRRRRQLQDLRGGRGAASRSVWDQPCLLGLILLMRAICTSRPCLLLVDFTNTSNLLSQRARRTTATNAMEMMMARTPQPLPRHLTRRTACWTRAGLSRAASIPTALTATTAATMAMPFTCLHPCLAHHRVVRRAQAHGQQKHQQHQQRGCRAWTSGCSSCAQSTPPPQRRQSPRDLARGLRTEPGLVGCGAETQQQHSTHL